LLAKVLDHIVPFRLTMHQQVQPNFLLETDNGLDLFFDEILVLFNGNSAFA
jgi:hypothetical protein